MAKFNFHKFVSVLQVLGPLSLNLMGVPDKFQTILPNVITAIQEAEQIKGSGAAKKAHALATIAAAVAASNAAGRVQLDPAEVAAIADHGIETVLGIIHVQEGARAVKPAAVPPQTSEG